MGQTENRTKDSFEKIAVRVSKVSIVGNVLLSLLKLLAGIIANSSAMVSDAIHSASDVFSSVVVIIGVRLAAKESDEEHPYGHERMESVAAVILSVVLAVTGLFIGYDAIGKLTTGAYENLKMPGMLAAMAAVFSIVVKEAMYWYTRHFAVSLDSGALMADAWHHRSDALSSIGSLLGIGGAIFLGGKWAILDPLAGCVIGIVIIYLGVKMALPALNELSEASLSDAEKAEISACALAVKGVVDIHNLQTRRSGPNIIIDAHVVVDGNISVAKGHEICDEVEKAIMDSFGSQTQISLHTEPDGIHDTEKIL